MNFLDWLGVPENVATLKRAAQDTIQTGVASVLGDLEFDLKPKILDPIMREMDGFVSRSLQQLDVFVDKQLAKLKNIRVSY